MVFFFPVNRALAQFFEERRRILEGYRINELTYNTKRDVAVMSQVGALWDRNDWRKYANNMGINNAHVLAVSVSSHPLYMILVKLIICLKYFFLYL